MASVIFDRHAFIKRLTAAGMPEQQAGILAEERVRLIGEHLATKADLKALEDRLTDGLTIPRRHDGERNRDHCGLGQTALRGIPGGGWAGWLPSRAPSGRGGRGPEPLVAAHFQVAGVRRPVALDLVEQDRAGAPGS
jgi:hypothetical protein